MKATVLLFDSQGTLELIQCECTVSGFAKCIHVNVCCLLFQLNKCEQSDEELIYLCLCLDTLHALVSLIQAVFQVSRQSQQSRRS